MQKVRHLFGQDYNPLERTVIQWVLFLPAFLRCITYCVSEAKDSIPDRINRGRRTYIN